MRLHFRVVSVLALASLVACTVAQSNDNPAHHGGDDDDHDAGATCADAGTTEDGAADAGHSDGHAPDAAASCGWTPYNEGLSGSTIEGIVFDLRAPGVVYATGGGKLYQSADSGHSWHAQSAPDHGVHQIALPGTDPSYVLATSSSGVIASRDQGKTWTQLALDGIALETLTVAPSQPLRLYGTLRGNGMMISDDGGQTWWEADNQYPYFETISVDVDPRDPDTVLAGGSLLNSPYDGELVRTSNGGATWDVVLKGVANIWDIRRCTSNPDVVYAAATGGVARSNDGGKTWPQITPLTHGATAVAVSGSSCDDIEVVDYQVGPRHSTDGGLTFGPPKLQGLNITPIGTWPGPMVRDPKNDSAILLGTHGGLYTTFNAAAGWQLAPGILGMQIRALSTSPLDASRLWLASWGSGVWQRPSAQLPWERVSYQQLPVDFTFGVAADPFTANRVLVGTWSPVFQSNDGTTFTAASGTADNPFSFAFDPTDSQTIYAATQLAGVLKTSDGGATWSPSNGSIAPWPTGVGTVIYATTIAVDPSAPHTVYVGTNGGGLFKSADAGASWTSVLAPGKSVGCVLVVPGAPSTVYACIGGGGLQSSSDGGTTWTDAGQGLPSLDLSGLARNAQSGDLFATVNRAVYAKHGAQPWTIFDDCLPSKAPGSPAIVADGVSHSLVVTVAGEVWKHAL